MYLLRFSTCLDGPTVRLRASGFGLDSPQVGPVYDFNADGALEAKLNVLWSAKTQWNDLAAYIYRIRRKPVQHGAHFGRALYELSFAHERIHYRGDHPDAQQKRSAFGRLSSKQIEDRVLPVRLALGATPAHNELRPVRRGPCDQRDGTRRLRCLFLFPLRGLRGFAPILIQLHDPFARAVELIPVGDIDPIFSRQHSSVTFEQEWFGFGVLLLSG
jgi:hypothetical protein